MPKGIYTRTEEHKTKIRKTLLGKHVSPKSEFKIGHKTFWSDKSKMKLSKSMTGKICSEETKIKMSLARKGHNVSKETRKKISEHMKGKHPSEEIIKIIKEKRAKQIIPKQDTKIEIKIQDFLNKLQIPYHAHHYISEIEHRYNCDIFIPSIKTIIECDGDYWHGNPEFYNEEELNKRQREQIERDKKRTKELLEKGYKVIRLWENQIKEMKLKELTQIMRMEVK